MTAQFAPKQAVQGAWTDVFAADGTRFRAHVTAPSAGTGPALVVVHGAAGLDATIVALCRRFADEGYAVLVD